MADLMCPDDIYYTKAQLVDMVMAQRPETAIDVWDNKDEARRRCLTCIIRHYRDEDGTEYVFDAQKQNAVNVRVSTKKQRSGSKDGHELDDGGVGWRDQISLALGLAIVDSKKTHCPIRVYNDGGFSGTYPPDDPVLIREMRLTRAETYRSAFQEMVVDRCTDPEIKADVAAWLKHHIEVISGVGDEGEDDLKIKKAIFPEPPDRSFDEVEGKLKLRYNCHKNFNFFRPAVHFLLTDLPVINAIFCYDVDRLSRDYALSEVMSRRLALAGVNVFTCTADAGYVTGQNWQDIIMRAVYLGAAAEFVKKNLRQILRSHFTALSAGRPMSDIPIWLRRDKNKKVTWDREYLPLVEAAISTWMNTRNYKGHRTISTAVNAKMAEINAGITAPEHHLKPRKSKSGVFVEPSTRYWLHNPVIYGCVQQWGRSWPLAPGEHVDAYQSPFLRPDPDETVPPLALISQKQWERVVRARIAEHPKKRGRTTTNKRPLSSILKCRCGASLYFHRKEHSGESQRDQWTCHTQPDEKAAILEQTGLKWHIGISNDQMMDIIDGIMLEAPGLLRATQEQEQEVDARYAQMVAERDRIRAESADRAKTALPGMEETSEAFQTVKRTILLALGGGDIEAQVNRMEVEIYQRQQEPPPPTVAEEMSFASLSPRRQNEILTSLIKEIRTVQPNGPADLRDEYLEIVKRDGTVLAPIRCVQTRILSTGLAKFRLPTFAEWIASLASAPVDSIQEANGV